MHRRDNVSLVRTRGKVLFIGILLGLALAAFRSESTAAEPPINFLIFLADDQGENDLSCYGHPVLHTPNIDRLATEGMRFDRAFLTISSCSPSRSSILTG
ncbi:MAG TPA: sulfatase-like hydrolase/transferase, partial [Thermoguttaceae bacterium]|nr:sulfatase-like hydrolase/transferase [Thermoguttaceae bacterium]